jgi:hypothetical protein
MDCAVAAMLCRLSAEPSANSPLGYNDMDVIAERHLELRTEDRSIAVVVKLGRPESTGEDWCCPYEIWFGDTSRSMAMHGADAMQALQLSIATLDVELEYGAEKRGGRLYHFDEPFTSMLENSGLQVKPPRQST